MNKSIYFNDLSSFLRINDLIRLKGNFIHNGFDRMEYIINTNKDKSNGL